jgi:hypothetical protein
MNCPQCGNETRCKYTRALTDGSVRRRRRCVYCEFRFSTKEAVESFISQGRDEHGRFAPVGNDIPKGYYAPVPDCKRCEQWWASCCDLGHPDPSTCGSFKKAAQ